MEQLEPNIDRIGDEGVGVSRVISRLLALATRWVMMVPFIVIKDVRERLILNMSILPCQGKFK